MLTSGDGGCDVPLAIVDGVDETMGDTLVELFVGATLGGVDETTHDTVAELFVGDRLSGVDKTRGDTLAELFVGDALDGVDKTVGGDILLVEPNVGSTALAVAEVTKIYIRKIINKYLLLILYLLVMPIHFYSKGYPHLTWKQQ